MSGRHLTEPEAWREIARRIAEAGRVQYGLCYEVVDLWSEERVSALHCLTMNRRIKQHLYTHRDDTWAYRLGTQPEARILAALWLALEAEEEGA